jgi:hypothetical protein
VDECKPLAAGLQHLILGAHAAAARYFHQAAKWQGLTLVHFSAQLKRIVSDRGAFRDCFGGV